MSIRRVAIVQPSISLGGGTEAVTAWAIESLKRECQVSLITFSRVVPDDLNHFYGTDLHEDEFSIIRPGLPRLLLGTKRFSLLKDHLMMRYCKSSSGCFDLLFSVGAGVDVGCKSIQYFGFKPTPMLMKEAPRWHYLLKKPMVALCELASAFSEESMTENITLVNSKWTGEAIEHQYGVQDYEVVYPPVTNPLNKTLWELRQEGFVLITRIDPFKRIEQAIETIKCIRNRGFDVSLHIAGRRDDPRYFEQIKRICDENAPWLFMHGLLSREDLFDLMDQYKYGINAALDEPFGIAVAEMVKAGCMVFVPNAGGQTEIVDAPELVYNHFEDAVDKITCVLNDEALQRTLLGQLQTQGMIFSTESFCRRIQGVVNDYFEHTPTFKPSPSCQV